MRQKGGHVVLRRAAPFAQVIGPMHECLDIGTLAAIS
jgi:predicted RNA binding protein YcfA (HicA-like mRNA interferase family)